MVKKHLRYVQLSFLNQRKSPGRRDILSKARRVCDVKDINIHMYIYLSLTNTKRITHFFTNI